MKLSVKLILCLLIAFFAATVLALAAEPRSIQGVQPVVKPPILKGPITRPPVPGYDLVVMPVTLSAPLFEGDKYAATGVFRITIKNLGLDAAAPQTQVKITTTALAGGPVTTQLSGTVACPSLPPGGTHNITWPGPSSSVWLWGNYRLTVELTGANTADETNKANNTRTFDFTVTGFGRGAIMVWDDDMQHLLPGANLSLTGNGVTKTAQTDFTGAYNFGDLRPGTYQVAVSKTGYKTETKSLVVENGKGSQIAVLLAKLRGSATITVTDGAAPLAGVPVTGGLTTYPVDRPNYGVKQTVTTNDQGIAVFNNLYLGENSFSARKEGYDGYGVKPTVAAGSMAAATITLVRDTGNAGVYVRDDTGRNVSGAAVSVPVGSAVRTQTTDAAGEATFTGLPTGPYTFTVALAGYNNATASLTINKYSKQNAIVTLARQRNGSAAITVTDGANPLAGAAVGMNAPGVAGVSQTTDAAGRAVFTGLLPGQYNITAHKDSYADGTAAVTVALDTPAAATVALTRQTGGIDIWVRDANSGPVAGATVTGAMAAATQTQTTGADGKAIFFGLPTGQWTFTIAKTGYNTANLAMNIEFNYRQSPSVTLTRESGSAVFTVTDGASPVAGADVHLLSLSGLSISQRTGADGKTTFTGLLPGQYAATAGKYAYSDSPRATVTVAVNAQAAATLVLTRQQTVAATHYVSVYNFFGEAIGGAAVTLSGNGLTRTQTTGADGKATFTGMPIGDYTLNVVKAGYNTFNHSYYQLTTTGGNFSVQLTQ